MGNLLNRLSNAENTSRTFRPLSGVSVVGFRVRVNIYDNHDYDDEDRHGVIMKMMESMMVREIMKMLTRIEKHCGVGGGA